MVSAPSRERPTTEQPAAGTPVLDSVAATYKVTLFTCLFVPYTLCLRVHRKRKFPMRKKIILRVRKTLDLTLISIAGAGRGRNYFSNTFASPGKVVSVVFSCSKEKVMKSF